MQMTDHEKASAIASKLRNIRMEVIVTAEDILLKCQSREELGFYYRILIERYIKKAPRRERAESIRK